MTEVFDEITDTEEARERLLDVFPELAEEGERVPKLHEPHTGDS